MHINEGKGKIALFYTANNVLLTPLLFTILLFSFRNFFIPIFSSSSSSFLLFSLHHRHISIVFPPPPPPPPHFYCFPSTTTDRFTNERHSTSIGTIGLHRLARALLALIGSGRIFYVFKIKAGRFRKRYRSCNRFAKEKVCLSSLTLLKSRL